MMNEVTFDPEFTDKDITHELNKWIGEKQQQISDCQKKLKNSPDDKQIEVQLKQAQDSLSKFQKTRSHVLANQSSSNWL